MTSLSYLEIKFQGYHSWWEIFQEEIWLIIFLEKQDMKQWDFCLRETKNNDKRDLLWINNYTYN